MAAFEQPKSFVSAPAGEDFELKHRYTGVGLTSNGLTTASAATTPYGVLYLPEKTGIACKVMVDGIAMCKVAAAGDLTLGQQVEFNASGELIAHASGVVVGVMQADAPKNSIGAVLLQLT